MQKSPSTKRVKLDSALVLSLMLVLAGCATIPFFGTEPRVDVNAVACGAFSPITYSRNDTAETRRQIEQHNASWMALCGN